MKPIIQTLLLFSCTFFLMSSCKKDSQLEKLSEASGTLNLKLDGESINFTIDQILLPYAFNCEDEDLERCRIIVRGESDIYNMNIIIWKWEKGNYPLNATDSTGFYSFDILIGRKDATEFSNLLVFGSHNLSDNKKSNWNVLALQNFKLPDRDPLTGEWKNQYGKFDKLEATFDATDINDKKVTEGHLNISYK